MPQERFELPTPSFGGDENSRGQVLQFVQVALGQIALKVDGAVVCNAYPSRAGMSSGTGDSGSTGMVRRLPIAALYARGRNRAW